MSAGDGGDWQRVVLRETLAFAVPMHMQELQGRGPEMLAEIASSAASVIAQHGDDLQFRGKHCVPAFNALARGLAAAALTAWGGVDFQGLHWCTVPCCPGRHADHPQPYPDYQAQHSAPATLARPVVDLQLPDLEESTTP